MMIILIYNILLYTNMLNGAVILKNIHIAHVYTLVLQHFEMSNKLAVQGTRGPLHLSGQTLVGPCRRVASGSTADRVQAPSVAARGALRAAPLHFAGLLGINWGRTAGRHAMGWDAWSILVV